MKHFRFVFIMLALVCCGSMKAQDQQSLKELMRTRGEYYFTLNVDDPHSIQAISEICSVDGTDGKTVVAYANQQEYDRLLKAGYQPNLQTPPSLRAEAKMWEGGDRATYEWNSYLTYGDYVSMMEGFPTLVTNGASCTFLDLGTLSTTNHRRILGVRLNNGQPNGKPKFLYTSTMHGDEVTGMILMLRLINEFCTSTDTRIQNILNNVDLFIFPCTNPDGTYNGGNNTVTGAKRYNGNNVDLNRHFPDFDDGAHPDGASYYQDEAQWMMDLAQEFLFTMGANYHGGAEVMNYPWDTYQPVHPDDAWWQYISLEYVRLARQVYSSYMSDTESNGITNGYAWYTITGSRQDYMNYYGQCREITIECSSTKTPSASQLPNFWNYNHNSMLALIEQSLNGIHGVVRDANTNETIEGATITVQNHDALGSSVTSHAVGDFHRPIKGGNWTIKVTKEGYCSETVDVTLSDDQRVDLEIYLTPVGSCQIAMDCYEQTTPMTAGSYVIGYLNNSTLVMPTHNSSSTVTTTSATVNATENGFSVEEEANLPQVTLTEYQTSGQYYISYNGRYLARSSYGNSLTWSTSQSNYGRWYINENGIYVIYNNRNYYLYYNNGSFALSTTQHNNIAFYVAGDCPATEFTITATANPTDGGTIEGAGTYTQGETCTLTATPAEGYAFINWTEDGEEVSTELTYSFEVIADRELDANFEENTTTEQQTITLNKGWNWWSTNLDVTLEQLETALAGKATSITSQNDGFVNYVSALGWTGSLNTLSPA
ncbi:MAG: succinylglutamate desuccinylase/aspartoacylase family protein, partial [Bacteroidales bacterium]|nr:succinylglutamate desuccinylase/aspartoacylase family protein [Bacteroidales bacterium]